MRGIRNVRAAGILAVMVAAGLTTAIVIIAGVSSSPDGASRSASGSGDWSLEWIDMYCHERTDARSSHRLNAERDFNVRYSGNTVRGQAYVNGVESNLVILLGSQPASSMCISAVCPANRSDLVAVARKLKVGDLIRLQGQFDDIGQLVLAEIALR